MKEITSLKQYKAKKHFFNLFIILMQILLFVIFLLIWEISARFKWIDPFLVSSPSAIFNLFISYTQQNILFSHIKISVIETIIGLIIGTLLGFIIATILFLIPTIDKILDPYLIVLNALPKTALAPILIIWAGTNIKGIVVVAISLNLIITIISTLTYFKTVDQNLIKMLKTMNATPLQILFKLIYPANVENILSIIKVNIGLTWVGVIVGEFLVSREGIGYLVVYGGQVFKLDLVMMGVFILALIALIMYEIINLVEFILKKSKNKTHKK